MTYYHLKYLSIFLGLLLISFSTKAQEIENLFYSLEGSNVIVTYDLIGEPDQLFRVEVFSSHNSYSAKLLQVTGDVGENIAPGTGKNVTWDAGSELGNYDGSIELEVRANLIPPFLQFSNITTGSSFKRGKSTTIQWISNSSESNIKLVLEQSGQKLSDIGTVPNNGNYTWLIPKNRKPGKNFKMVAYTTDKIAYSATFRISPKIPVVLKILPIAVLGGIAAVIASSGGGKGGTTDPTPEKIIDPLKPRGN